MAEPIPFRYSPGPADTSLENDTQVIATELLTHYGGYAVVGTADPATSERLCAEIARAYLEGPERGGPFHTEPVIDATDPRERTDTSALPRVPGVRTVPTRPGLDLEAWGREIAALRPRIILAGQARQDRMEHIRALRGEHDTIVVLTTPVYGHARSLEWLLATARAGGLPIEPRSVFHTLQAIEAREPCRTCYGFWCQTPRAKLVERYGKRTVDILESKTSPEERSQIRTWSLDNRCPVCRDRDHWAIGYSQLEWTWELTELLRRDAGPVLDHALVADRYRWTPTALNVLVKVAFGECCPQALAHPDLTGEIEYVAIDADILRTLRETE